MGTRGPAPTPTETLRRRGSWRANTRDGEPRPEVVAPKRPRWLSKDAAVVWEAIVPLLLDMGILARTDESVLATYCESYAEVVTLTRRIRREGFTRKTAKGYIYPNPLVAIRERSFSRMSAAEKRLGLSPADRTRVRITPTDDEPKAGDWWETN